MKSLIDFESAQPFAVQFFTQAFENNHLVNAYILRCKDMNVSYAMALRLAQIICCTNRPAPSAACGQCQPCRWTEENANPNVITLSNLTYRDKLDHSKEQTRRKAKNPPAGISVEQLEHLIAQISLHSGGENRVVILTAAAESSLAPEELSCAFPPPQDRVEWRDGTAFQPVSLDHKNFGDSPSNKFLKTLEEPPRDVTFFLLTDGDNRLLETIVSRCQFVPMQTPAGFYNLNLPAEEQAAYTQLLKTLVQSNYWIPLEQFTQIKSDTGLETTEVLSRFQAFFSDFMMRETLKDQRRYERAKKVLVHLDKAKAMITAHTREDAVLEDLFLALTRL